jgi:hypothetical protein
MPPPVDLVDEAVPMLLSTLKALRLLGPALDLFGRFPTLESASLRLTWLVTPFIEYPITGQSVLEHCLVAAVRAGTTARGTGCNVRHAFVQAMLTTACMLMEIEVRSREGRWDPLHDEPMGTWRSSCRGIFISQSTATDRVFRSPADFYTGLAIRLIDAADLTDFPLNMVDEGRAA